MFFEELSDTCLTIVGHAGTGVGIDAFGYRGGEVIAVDVVEEASLSLRWLSY